MKKLYITIITIITLILAFSFGAYAYIQSFYKSNASEFETSYEDNISITVEIAENKKLIPYGAIISRVDETTELTVKVVVKSDIRMLYKLKHNLSASYELVGWQVWFPYEIDKENTHTFKIRLLENIQSMTSNIIFELYDIVLLEG